MKKPTFLSSRDAEYLVKDAEKSVNAQRRNFLKQGLTLGGIMLLTGCDLSDNDSVETALSRMSRFNDRVQGFLFIWHRSMPKATSPDLSRLTPFTIATKFRRSTAGIINSPFVAWCETPAAGLCLSCIVCNR